MVQWFKSLLYQNGQREAISRDELRRRAEALVAEAGFRGGAEEAYRLLDTGELDGTQLEVDLRMLRYLEQGSHPDRRAA